MEPSRAMFLVLPPVVFWVATLGALGLFLFRVVWLIRLLGVEPSHARLADLGERVRGLVLYVFGQRRLFHDPYPGVLHVVIFWGFLVLSLGTVQTVGRGFNPSFVLPILGDNPIFALLLDLFALAVLIAVGLAVHRRLVLRPSRLTLSPDGLIILALIATLMLTQLLAEGFALAAAQSTSYWWVPIGTVLANAFAGLGRDGASTSYGILWWIHVLVLLSFLVYLPFSKHLHILAAPFNVFFRDLGPKGALPAVDIAGQETFGAVDVWGFSWKDRLDLLACTECGRCQEQCPAYLSGKPLSPKQLVNDLKHHLFAVGPGQAMTHRNGASLMGSVVAEDAVWACTTCRACQEFCPVLNGPMNKIVEMRRGSVLMKGSFPAEAKPALQCVENQANPWGMWFGSRGEALENLKVKRLTENTPARMLLFVGCTGSFDERSKKVTAALIRLLKKAEVDFGVLGADEKCCGDPARRIGEEYLFQELARQNIETFRAYGVTRIVTACPHCFNVLKNEYPQLGGTFEVVHHSQLLLELMQQGKITPSREIGRSLTYHDPCYLGRHNETYDAPRAALGALPGAEIREMLRSRARSFCCGGGGGHMWMAERVGQRINQMRVEEAVGMEVETIATACPFCLIMLEDGVTEKGLERRVQVRDLAELLEAATP